MVEHREATRQMFECTTLHTQLKVPKDVAAQNSVRAVGYNCCGKYETVDFRTEAEFQHLYPTGTPPGYKVKFFRAYHLVGDISQQLIAAIVAGVGGIEILRFNRAGGAYPSLVRSLNYIERGAEQRPHIDPGYLTLAMRGSSPGLAIKNPTTGRYDCPEHLMDVDSELIALANLDLEQMTRKAVRGSVHCATTTLSRTVSVFSVNPGMQYAVRMDRDQLGEQALIEASLPSRTVFVE